MVGWRKSQTSQPTFYKAGFLFMILSSNILLRITHRNFRALTSTCRSSTMAAANAAADALDPNRGSKNTLKLENVRTSRRESRTDEAKNFTA